MNNPDTLVNNIKIEAENTVSSSIDDNSVTDLASDNHPCICDRVVSPYVKVPLCSLITVNKQR